MRYPETLYTALASVSAGGAVYCALCMLAAAVFHRTYKKWRLSVLCVLLSTAIACTVLLFVFTPFRISELNNKSAVMWVILFTAAGMFCIAFYRVVLPAAAVFYVLLFVFTAQILRSRYPLPHAVIPLSVYRGRFASGEVSGMVCTGADGSACIKLDVCTLPSRLLFPLPRTWYAFHSESHGLQLPQKRNFLHTAAGIYTSFVVQNTVVAEITVPSGAEAAVLYLIDCRSVPPVLIRVL